MYSIQSTENWDALDHPKQNHNLHSNLFQFIIDLFVVLEAYSIHEFSHPKHTHKSKKKNLIVLFFHLLRLSSKICDLWYAKMANHIRVHLRNAVKIKKVRNWHGIPIEPISKNLKCHVRCTAWKRGWDVMETL